MFKWLKRGVAVFTLLVVLVLLGYWGAIQWIDFNQFKAALQKQAAQKGLYLNMEHTQLEASAFPFRLQAKQLAGRLDGRYLPDKLQRIAFQVQQLEVTLSLWALFVEQKIRITHLQVIQPEWTFILAEGKEAWARQQFNSYPLANDSVSALPMQGWAFYPASLSAQSEVQKPNSPSLVEWQLKSVFLEKGRLQIQSAQKRLLDEWHQIQIMAFDIQMQKDFPLSLQYQFKHRLAHSEDYLKGDVALNAKAQYLPPRSLWQLMQLHGSLSMQLPEALKVPLLKLQLDLQQLQFAAQKRQLKINGLHLAGLGSEIALDLEADLASKHWQGAAVLSAVNLRSWARHMNIALPNFTHSKALTDISGSFYWQWQPLSWQLEKLDLNWDGTQVEGAVWQQQLSDKAPLEFNFDLKLDRLNLEHYQAQFNSQTNSASKRVKIPSPAFGKQAAEANSQLQQDQVYLPFAVPVSTLRKLKAKGHLQVGELVVQQARLQNLALTLHSEQGELALAPLDFELYGGQWQSKIQLNVQGDTPVYRMKGRMDRINLADLWQDLKVSAMLTGIASGRFQLSTQGSNWMAWLGHMQGRLRLSALKGQISGGNLHPLLQGKEAALKQLTDFQQLLLEGKVRQGIYHVKKVYLQTPHFKAQGLGTMNWVTQAIDFTLKARLLQPKDARLAQAVVPFKIQGTWQKPVWQLEVAQLLNTPENQALILQKLEQLLQKK